MRKRKFCAAGDVTCKRSIGPVATSSGGARVVIGRRGCHVSRACCRPDACLLSAQAPCEEAMQHEKLQCRNLHEYMRSLSPAILDRLYNHPATCLAVFRELSSLARNYVMRLLFLDQPLPQAAVTFWVKKDNQRDHDDCMGTVTGLRLWHSQQLPGGLQGLVLNPIFKENLRIALLGGGKAWADDTSQLGPDKHVRDITSLDKYAMERWEVILHFMVGSPSAAVSQDLAQLLIQAGLMKSEPVTSLERGRKVEKAHAGHGENSVQTAPVVGMESGSLAP
ncbi:general transcription factor IIH subunit 4 [Rhinoraja longicauda]